MCKTLSIALDESSDLAPAWYTDAGDLLFKCGVDNAKLKGIHKSCYASRISDDSIDCTKETQNYFDSMGIPR